MMPSRRRSFIAVPAFIAVCSLGAGLLMPTHHVKAASTLSDEDQLKQSSKAFTKVYSVVEENFADAVKPEKAIYKGAIPGMLRTLDPHSNFFDPKDYKELRTDQSGHYSGVGMMVGARNERTIVLAPFAGYPAYKAGLRAGDALLEIDDKKTDGLNTTEIAERLKGPKGTKVQIKPMFKKPKDDTKKDDEKKVKQTKASIPMVEPIESNTTEEWSKQMDASDQRNLRSFPEEDQLTGPDQLRAQTRSDSLSEITMSRAAAASSSRARTSPACAPTRSPRSASRAPSRTRPCSTARRSWTT